MVEEKTNIFFKYRAIDDNTIKILENQEFYFSKSSEFNDPFDSKLDLIWRGKREDWRLFYIKHGVTDSFEFRHIMAQSIKNGSLKRKKGEFLLDPDKKAYKKLRKDVQLNGNLEFPRVCCFSQENNNILMWSHYADEHNGICFCFRSKRIEGGNFLVLDSDDYLLFPVAYQEDMPKQVNMLSNYEHEELAAFLYTKHFMWEYENEYRLIMWPEDFKSKNQFTKKFRKQDLEGVIFGLNTPIEDIRQIYDIIDKNYLQEGFRVNFFKY